MKNKNERFKLIDVKEDGKSISPVLPEEVKNYMIDIDGTICDDIPNEEPERMATAELFDDALETINTWFEQGHIITFFTSRVEEHREVTEQWLKNNGCQYGSKCSLNHKLPSAMLCGFWNRELPKGSAQKCKHGDKCIWVL